MRYGHQPMSEIEKMSMDDMLMWANEVIELIKLENHTDSRED